MAQLAYAHKVDSGVTIAVDVPTKEFLKTMFTEACPNTLFLMGVSRVHPKDKYIKAVGREEAKKKMVPMLAYLKSITFRDHDRTVYTYKINMPPMFNKQLVVTMAFSFIRASEKVKIQYTEVRHVEISSK